MFQVAATNADFALLNSGTLRSDMIHPAGPFFVKDLVKTSSNFFSFCHK
jgi:hypothetical protein